MLVGGSGLLSAAQLLLSDGVPIVVASHWDVDDAATPYLWKTFYATLARGHSPAEALRHSQLSMLRSADPALVRPQVWGAFSAFGAVFDRM